jgi:hypothetical protein
MRRAAAEIAQKDLKRGLNTLGAIDGAGRGAHLMGGCAHGAWNPRLGYRRSGFTDTLAADSRNVKVRTDRGGFALGGIRVTDGFSLEVR